MKQRKPQEIVELVSAELPETLYDHLMFHSGSFESIFISFKPDGTWMLSGFGGEALDTMSIVSEVLAEVAKSVNTARETMH